MIDSPGHNDRAATETARCSDLVLIPSRPKVFDLETLATVRDLLRVAGDPPAFVLLNENTAGDHSLARQIDNGDVDALTRALNKDASAPHGFDGSRRIPTPRPREAPHCQ